MTIGAGTRKSLLITGGAGFIGSHLVDLALEAGHRVVVLDLLTYAGSPDNLNAAQKRPGLTFVHGDICDGALVARALFADILRRIDRLRPRLSPT